MLLSLQSAALLSLSLYSLSLFSFCFCFSSDSDNGSSQRISCVKSRVNGHDTSSSSSRSSVCYVAAH